MGLYVWFKFVFSTLITWYHNRKPTYKVSEITNTIHFAPQTAECFLSYLPVVNMLRDFCVTLSALPSTNLNGGRLSLPVKLEPWPSDYQAVTLQTELHHCCRSTRFNCLSDLFSFHRKYMQGSSLDTRISEALQSTFAELDKKEGESVDTLPYMSFMVGNIMTGLCFGGRYTAFIII